MPKTVAVRVAAGVAVVGVTAAVIVACSSAAGAPGTLPVPTFPPTASPASAGGTAAPDQVGLLPDDCARVLAGNDLGALFGLPLDSVRVQTTLGAPAPAVGRTERLACQYTRAGGAKDDLLDLNIGAYTNPDAAAAQWRTNVAAEDGDHRQVALGGAQGVLVERPEAATLLVANGAETLTFVLPERIRIRDLSAGDTLVDLALRVLPTVAAAAGPTPPAPAAPAVPAQPAPPAQPAAG